MKKKFIVTFLVVLMVVCCAIGLAACGENAKTPPSGTEQGEEGESGPYTYQLNIDGTSYTLVSCDIETSGEITIPATYNNKPVTAIGEGAFRLCSSITSVIIPDSITNIRENAFSDCDSLISTTIPNSVTNIGENAFRGCDTLAFITIPDSVTCIDSMVLPRYLGLQQQ